MRIHLLFVFWVCWLLGPVVAAAQDLAEPRVSMELEKNSAIPGQPIVLRLTLLVPTWLPEPPVFPSFEVPNVMVRLPARASGPISERVGSETWSGVTRAYRLYPMTVGQFRIPPQPVRITFADPKTRNPITMEQLTDEVVFEGRAPEAARDLDPFIAATALSLEQTIEGEPQNLEPGGAFTRGVTVHLEGTSPIFLPPLIPPIAAEGLSVYPKEPVVTDIDEGGTMSGDRLESVTYIAEAGGRHVAPPIRLSWFNLQTNEVETAALNGFDIVARGPAPSPPPIDWRAFAPWIVGGVLTAVLAGAAVAFAWPRVAAWHRRRREAYLASPDFAFGRAKVALRARDFNDTVRAIELWSSRLRPAFGETEPRLTNALVGLGAAYYGPDRGPPPEKLWSEARAALEAVRRERGAAANRAGAGHALPPLNPGHIS